MNTTPRIEMLNKKILVGYQRVMSFTNNKTFELWSSFMPRRKEITNSINTDLYSLEVYEPGYFNDFDPSKKFQKWAAVEVAGSENIPSQMETLILPAGMYAVFDYKGAGSKAFEMYRYIFTEWLPQSEYILDDRPHFALMGAKYKREATDSEEEIWIPVKHTSQW